MSSLKNEEIITTETFKVTNWKFAKEMIASYGKTTCIILLLIIISFSIIGIIFSEIRWIILSALVCFVISPMVLSFLYYNYGLKKECYCNTFSHNLEFSPQGIKVNMMLNESTEEDKKDNDDERFKIYSFFIPEKEVANYSLINEGIKINLKSGNKSNGFLITPYNIFKSESDFKLVIESLISKNS